ncbi:MAG: HAD family phosphatase [Ferruginibacter sp.]
MDIQFMTAGDRIHRHFYKTMVLQRNQDIDTVIGNLIDTMDIKAVIFDLDGTLIDNNSVHLLAWKKYLLQEGIDISDEAYRININGRTNKDALEFIYQKKMTDDEAMRYALEKEAVYRDIYKSTIKPVDGLSGLLEAFYQKHIPMAIATSGIQVNIDFMFEHIPIKKYFKYIVNSAHISKGKPDPEIYLKTAELLKVSSENCLVFEDAVVGVRAAHAAGMKVIAITTTQSKEELKDAELIIADFTVQSFCH